MLKAFCLQVRAASLPFHEGLGFMGEAPTIAWTKLLSSRSSSLSPALLDFYTKYGTQIPFKVLWSTTTSDGSIYAVTVAGSEPIRITKFNSDGSESWSTLEGEESGRYSSVLNADSDGSIYITGITSLGYGPYVNGASSPIIDIFVTKINSNGSKEWAKLGGNTQSYEHYVNSKIIYGDGSAYIVQSANPGSDDALIAKLNIDASKAWSKMLSGAYFKSAKGISIATDGSIYITGYKDGNDKTDSGYPNAFIIKYRSDGSKEWTKWLGGDFGSTRSFAVSTSVDGSIYITGETFGNLDSQTNSGGYDTFIAKFSSNGSKLWTKLIGGKSNDHATAVSTSSDGSVYISGYTSSSFDGQTNSGSTDAFITKLSSGGSKLWTKLIGGEGNESSFGVNTSNDGSIYIVGYKDGNIAGKGDVGGFITKLNSNETFTLTPSATTINEGAVLTSTLTSTNVASGTTLYYSLSGNGITTADFSSGALTGTGTVASNGSFAFSHTLANDLTTEGTETLNIKLFSDSSRSTQVGLTASVSIADTSISSKIKEVQSLSSSTTPIRYQRNKELTVPINYSTSDGSSTTGLSFKVHFNSSLLSFNSTTGITNKTQADHFQIGAIQQDTANSDNDATTDSFIPINVASFTGQFPTAGVPVKLADLIFKSLDKPIDPITGLKDTFINFSETEAASGYGFTATSASLKPLSFSLDVDRDGKVTALGDGLMIIRKLFSPAFAGDALINKAISPDSPYLNGIAYNTLTTQQKADVAAQVHANIQEGIDSKMLDVDKDSKTTALGDGLMVIRHLFGAAFAGAALTNKAISPDSPYFGPPANFAAVAANIDAMRPV